jgi:hypothetical protein
VFRHRRSLNAFPNAFPNAFSSASPLGDACDYTKCGRLPAVWRGWTVTDELLSPAHVHFSRPFKMVSAKLYVSVASLSDLLARYVAIARKSSEFAPIWTSEFHEDYCRVKYQLQRLQRICQKYSPLRYVYHSRQKI